METINTSEQDDGTDVKTHLDIWKYPQKTKKKKGLKNKDKDNWTLIRFKYSLTKSKQSHILKKSIKPNCFDDPRVLFHFSGIKLALSKWPLWRREANHSHPYVYLHSLGDGSAGTGLSGLRSFGCRGSFWCLTQKRHLISKTHSLVLHPSASWN